MDINRAFTYFKEDEEWVNKFLIGSVLFLTIIGAIPLLGWLVAIVRNKLEDENAKLPDWNDFGTYTVDGLQLMVLGFVWSIPIFAIMCLQFAVIFGGLGVGTLLESEIGQDAAFNLIMGTNLLSYCFYPFMFIFGIALGLLYYPAYGYFADSKSLGETIDPRKAWRILKANLGEYIVILALVYGLSMFASFGLFLCIIGIFPLYVYLYTVLGDLIAQAYKKSKENLALAEEATA